MQGYDDFKTHVRDARGPSGLVAIPDLRSRIGTLVPRETFDRYVMRLHEDGLVHLLTHVDPDSLTPEQKRDVLEHPSGYTLYWIRWL